MTNYPTSQDNSMTLPNPSGLDTQNSPDHAGLHTSENDAIIALETKLGTGSSTPSGSNLLISTGTGTSSWSKAAPTGTIVGTTDTQTLTNKTLTSPTLNTPTITNASITADAITGYTTSNSGSIYGLTVTLGALTVPGLLNANAGLTVSGTVTLPSSSITNTNLAGSISYAKLLSTIFSGQAQTMTNTGTAGGTIHYLDLGGIKISWGLTTAISATSSGGFTDVTVVWPTSFFTSQPYMVVSSQEQTSESRQFATIPAAPTTTSSTIRNINVGTISGTAKISYIAIGT